MVIPTAKAADARPPTTRPAWLSRCLWPARRSSVTRPTGVRASRKQDTLYTHALKGFTGKKGMMRPRRQRQLSDADVKAAVDYMRVTASKSIYCFTKSAGSVFFDSFFISPLTASIEQRYWMASDRCARRSVRALQVGNRACNLQYACAARALRTGVAWPAQQPRLSASSAHTCSIVLSRAENSLRRSAAADVRARLHTFRTCAEVAAILERPNRSAFVRRNLDVQVDAVEQRAGDAARDNCAPGRLCNDSALASPRYPHGHGFMAATAESARKSAGAGARNGDRADSSGSRNTSSTRRSNSGSSSRNNTRDGRAKSRRIGLPPPPTSAHGAVYAVRGTGASSSVPVKSLVTHDCTARPRSPRRRSCAAGCGRRCEHGLPSRVVR